MPYPNSNVLNIVIPQTSASIDPTSTQAPFVERIISGSRLILQTTIDGTLTGSSDLNVNSITASNISASGYISASNLYVRTNITDAGTLTVVGTSTFNGLVSASAGLTASAIQDAGTLTVVGATTLAGLTGTTATFSGLVSASAGLTASAIQDAGTLTVVGNSILSNVFATNVTASNISASGFVSASAIFDTGTLTVLGNSILSNVFATNVTASNISASGNISSSNLWVQNSIVDNGTLTVLGNTILANLTASNISASKIVASEITASSELFVGTGTAYRTYGEAFAPENLARLYVSGSVSITSKYATLNLATSASAPGAQSSILFSRLADRNPGSGLETVLEPRMQLGTESGSTDGGATTTYVSSLPGYAGIVGPDAMLTILPMDSASFGSAGSKQYNRNILNIMSYDTSSIMFISGSDGYVLLGKNQTDGINRLQVAGNISASAYTGSSAIITNITASNISASGNISASTLRVETSIVDGGSLTVLGNTILGDTTADTTRITGSTSISGSLTVVGTTTVTNLTASNISASGNISSSTLYVTNNGTINGDLTVNGGDIVLSNTATNISLLDNVGNALDIKEAANSYIKVATTDANPNVTFGTTPTVYVLKTTDNDLLTYDNGALQVGGGVGINKNLFVGANTYTVGNSSITGSLTVGTTLRVNGNSILGDALADVNTSSGSLRVLNTTQTTDYNIGALVVDGGVGIGKNLYVSGSTWLYGDLNIFGSSSVTNISSSTVIINDNIIQLNAYFPFERYAGFEVFDSGSNQRSASLLWDGQNDNWITVDQNNSASNIIIGPTASFGSAIPNLTVNRLPKAYEGNGITDSSLSDDGTTLRYTGTTISSSIITATTGSITYITGALVTYVTGSFTTMTITTGSSPGIGSQVPTGPTAAGMPGQINVDNNFVYVYTNNIWKRVPLSNWSA